MSISTRGGDTTANEKRNDLFESKFQQISKEESIIPKVYRNISKDWSIYPLFSSERKQKSLCNLLRERFAVCDNMSWLKLYSRRKQIPLVCLCHKVPHSLALKK